VLIYLAVEDRKLAVVGDEASMATSATRTGRAC